MIQLPAPVSPGVNVHGIPHSNLLEQEKALTRLQEKRRQVALQRQKLEQRMADARTGSSRSLTVDDRTGSSKKLTTDNLGGSTRSLSTDTLAKSSASKNITTRSAKLKSPKRKSKSLTAPRREKPDVDTVATLESPKRTSKSISTKTPDASPIKLGPDDETPVRRNTTSNSSNPRKSSSFSEPSYSIKALLSPPPLTGPKVTMSSKMKDLSASFSSFSAPPVPSQESFFHSPKVSCNKDPTNGATKKSWTPKVKTRSSSFSPGNGPSAPVVTPGSPEPVSVQKGIVKKRAQSFSGTKADAVTVASAAAIPKSSASVSKSRELNGAQPGESQKDELDCLSPRSTLEKRRAEVEERRKKLQERIAHAKEIMSPVATVKKVEKKSLPSPYEQVKLKSVPPPEERSLGSQSSSLPAGQNPVIVSSSSSGERCEDDTFGDSLLQRKDSNCSLQDMNAIGSSDPKAAYFNMTAKQDSSFSLKVKELSVSSLLTEDSRPAISPKSGGGSKKKVCFNPGKELGVSSLLSTDSQHSTPGGNDNTGSQKGAGRSWTPAKQASNNSLLSNDSQHSTQRAGRSWTPSNVNSSSNSLLSNDSQHSTQRAGRSWTPGNKQASANSLLSNDSQHSHSRGGKSWTPSRQNSGRSLGSTGSGAKKVNESSKEENGTNNDEDTLTTTASTMVSSISFGSYQKLVSNTQIEEDSMTSFDFSNREEDEGIFEVSNPAKNPAKPNNVGAQPMRTKQEWNNASWSVGAKDALLYHQNEHHGDEESELEEAYHCHSLPKLLQDPTVDGYEGGVDGEYIEEEYDTGDEEFFEEGSTEEADDGYLKAMQSDDDDDDSLGTELEVVIEEEWYEVEDENLDVQTDDEWMGEGIGEDDAVLSRKEMKRAKAATAVAGACLGRDSAATIIQSRVRGVLQRNRYANILEAARINEIHDGLDDEIECLKKEVSEMEIKLERAQEAAVDEILSLKKLAAKKKEEFRNMSQSLSERNQEMVDNHPEIVVLRAKNKKLRERSKQLEMASNNCRTNIVRLDKSNQEAKQSITAAKHGFFRNSVRNQQLTAQIEVDEEVVREYESTKRMRIEHHQVEIKNRRLYLDTLNAIVHMALRRLPDDDHHARLYADIEKTASVCFQVDTDRRRGE